MKKTSLIWSTFILFLFLFPVFANSITEGKNCENIQSYERILLYGLCGKCYGREKPVETTPGKALLYFTHSHEAYEPVTKAYDGKVAVSHQTENIMNIGEKLKSQLAVNGIETNFVSDNMSSRNAKETN